MNFSFSQILLILLIILLFFSDIKKIIKNLFLHFKLKNEKNKIRKKGS